MKLSSVASGFRRWRWPHLLNDGQDRDVLANRDGPHRSRSDEVTGSSPAVVRSGSRLVRQAVPVGAIDIRDAMRACAAHGSRPRHLISARRALASSRLDLLPSALDLRSGVIVDVGANVGDWTAAARLVAPEARVLTVEPVPELAGALRSRFAGDGKVEVVESAVSDCVGEATLHLTSHSHNGSLQRPRDMNHAYGSGWDSVGEVSVRTATLDELLAGQTASLVKIDVQGAEATVLRGAHDALQRTAAVLLEVTNRSHYEGDTLFPDLHRQMADLGFELANLSRPYLDTRATHCGSTRALCRAGETQRVGVTTGGQLEGHARMQMSSERCLVMGAVWTMPAAQVEPFAVFPSPNRIRRVAFASLPPGWIPRRRRRSPLLSTS